VDSRAVWEAGFTRAAALAGLDLNASQREALTGSSVESAGQMIASWADHRERSAVIVNAIEAALQAGAGSAPPRPLPGAMGLLTALSGRMPMAIASNGPPAVVAAMLEGAGLDGIFDHVVTAAEAPAPKPDPAVYRMACDRLRLSPARCVAVEDSTVGAASATKAGLKTYLVGPEARTARQALPWHLALRVRTVPSLADHRRRKCLAGTAQAPPGRANSLRATATGGADPG
jgi:HAD superfamily hydrolase (TIGR01509 family)